VCSSDLSRRGGPNGPNEDCEEACLECKAHIEPLAIERIAGEELGQEIHLEQLTLERREQRPLALGKHGAKEWRRQ